MFRKSTSLLNLGAVLAVAGCGREPPKPPAPAEPAAADSAYAAPPTVLEALSGPGGVALVGAAPAGVQVRLATPGGEAVFVRADPRGRWRIDLPAGAPRIFGLSEKLDGRQVQAQGYVLVASPGPAALLRAGAGAQRLDRRPAPSLGALDFDHDGAAVVSGVAAPDSLVFLRLDGRQIAETRADAQGRYMVSLPQPLSAGTHSFEAFGDAFVSRAEVAVGPAAALVDGPMRSQLIPGGLRVDWLTPGGGVQSTVLLD